MELGEKLRQARLDAGFSQRQLCGEEITRNMLSQIEHGTARPSMKTLQYLAARLGKPVSFFLEDTPILSPNLEVMVSARRLYDSGDPAGAALMLENYQAPDEIFDREKGLLLALCQMDAAQIALAEGRTGYALTLLEKAGAEETAYCGSELQRRRLLLLGRIRGQRVSEALPSLDEELLLRAREALDGGNPERAARLLDAAENQSSSEFCYLRGRACLEGRDYGRAAAFLRRAEQAYPQVFSLLEVCYRELGDYKLAYEYACKQRLAGKQP